MQGEQFSEGEDAAVGADLSVKSSLPGIFIEKQTLRMLLFGAISFFHFLKGKTELKALLPPMHLPLYPY